MHVLYNQIKGGEGRVGFRGITVIAGGGTNLQVVLIQKIFPWESEGKGGGVPRHIFANLISLNFPEGEG